MRAISLIGSITLWCLVAACAEQLRSPDGEYQAVRTGSGGDLHYQVKDAAGRELFTTRSAWDTPNDVKAGSFSPDSKRFGAVYHFGHRGPESYVVVYDVRTGNRVHEQWLAGWIYGVTW